ncbi:hypothetical protein [Polaromonas sp.]|uniref:hypothetical protein n=1 Tax=Polaromonas sp. TaxID=1869339 RepID=UPI003264EA39
MFGGAYVRERTEGRALCPTAKVVVPSGARLLPLSILGQNLHQLQKALCFFTMQQELQQLNDFTDISALRPALHSLCSRFGSVARLDILAASQAGRRQALCFLRMNSPAEERELMTELGVGRFGGDLVVIVDLQAANAAHSPHAALAA